MTANTAYTDHTHPDAFVDFERMQLEPHYNKTKECPRCKGFGGWNLMLNAYQMPKGYEDTAYNRNRYVHFRATCGTCDGWGFVEPNMNCTGHDWISIDCNRYQCMHCQALVEYDTSD